MICIQRRDYVRASRAWSILINLTRGWSNETRDSKHLWELGLSLASLHQPADKTESNNILGKTREEYLKDARYGRQEIVCTALFVSLFTSE
jgi:hypothetical protein